MAISPHLARIRARIGHDYLLVPAVTAVVVDDFGRILLHRSSDDGRWYLIGGAIDPDEQPEEAVVREVREETGLNVVVEALLGVHATGPRHYPNGDETAYVGIEYRCRPIAGEAHAADDESLEVRFFAEDELPTLDAHHERAIRRARSRGTAPS